MLAQDKTHRDRYQHEKKCVRFPPAGVDAGEAILQSSHAAISLTANNYI